MKRFTLVSLLAMMALSLHAYDFKSGDLYYNITDNGEYGGSPEVEVTYQEPNSPNNYSGLTSIVIPESVSYNGTTYIVSAIGDSAFLNCTGLTSVTIPNSVTSYIGHSAFEGCIGLTSMRIPNANNICTRAFYDCTNLTSLSFGDSLLWIQDYAFSGCIGLTSVTIPSNVQLIQEGAFSSCRNLTSVIWNAKNCKNDYSRGDEYTPFGDTREHITSFTFGEEVENIPGGLCYGMDKLSSIVIPNSVTSIGESAFEGCSGLTSISIPNGVTSIEWSVFRGCSGLTSITIPNGVTSIGASAFSGCSSLTSITIPNGVTSIGSYAFSDCSSLTSVTIPNGVTSIEDDAFWECSSLTSVAIPNSVTSIGDDAFNGCRSLINITIPNRVRRIGYGAFAGVLNVVYSGIADGAPWGARFLNRYVEYPFIYTDATKTTLLYCSRIATGEITIPNSVTNIADSAFYDCGDLTSVTIPNSVTSIGEYAFDGVFNVVYSGSAEGAPWGARFLNGYMEYPLFYADSTKATLVYCNQEVEGVITIPNSVTSIGKYAFDGCSGLTSITISNGVTSIGAGAFYDCSGLTSITIPNSVTSIGAAAFYKCNGLREIVWNAKQCNIDFIVDGNGNFYPSPFSSYSDYTGVMQVVSIRDSITSFVFGNEVENIPDFLCSGMHNLISITSLAIVPPMMVNRMGNSSAISTNATLHVPCNSVSLYTDSKWHTMFPNIACISDGSVPSECNMSATASDNATYIEWDAYPNAASYSLALISADDYARLLTITFDRDGKAQEYDNIIEAERTEKGFGFRQLGLKASTKYVYSMTIKDAAGKMRYASYKDFTTEPIGTMTVTPAQNRVAFAWYANPLAETYLLTLYSADKEALYSLTFDAEGKMEGNNKIVAKKTGNNFVCVLTGFEASTLYYYTMSATDKNNYVLNEYSNSFLTHDNTDGINDVQDNGGASAPRKVIRDGQVYIERGGKTYSVIGSEIK